MGEIREYLKRRKLKRESSASHIACHLKYSQKHSHLFPGHLGWRDLDKVLACKANVEFSYNIITI
jgi:hypothetical protein